MTATIGVTFGAGSAVKRILLFAINVTVLLLGVTCSVLCLYQVKLMPETYDVIVAALLESNLTTAPPLLSPIITVPGIRNNGRNTTRSGGSNKGRPRVSRYVGPENGNASNQPVYPVTFVRNFTSSTEIGTTATSYLDVQSLDITKAVALSQTGKTASLTISSTMAKPSVANSNTTINRVVTPTSLTNTMEETINFGQVLKDRIAELENELRLVQLREKVTKSAEQENRVSTTVSSLMSLPIGELNFSDPQTSSTLPAITASVTSWPGISIPTAVIQQSTEPTQNWTTSTPITTKSLITTSWPATIISSTPSTLLLPTSRQTLAGISTENPAGTVTMSTTTPSKNSTASTTLASIRTSALISTATPTFKSTTGVATRLDATPIVSISTSTTFAASPAPTSRTSVTETASAVTSTTRKASNPTTTPTRIVTEIPISKFALTSTTLAPTFTGVSSTKSSIPETSTLTVTKEVSLISLNLINPAVTSFMPSMNPLNASFSTDSQATLTSSSEEQVSSTLIEAITNPTTRGSILPSMQTTTPFIPLLTAISLSSSTQKASASSTMITTTIRPLSTTNAPTSSVGSSTKSISTSTTTASSMGFINLTNVFDSISKLVGRRDLSSHRLHKRLSASTVAPAINSADTLTADHIPIYFEQVFFFVQTSLYVCTAAGLLIFFSSLVGICGGLFRIDGCLKFSVAALVLVIMAEMATTAFIFLAHDKASNRNKNKNFDRDLKLLCDLANFCIQPILLVITGSFLCISVVLQIGSMTLACNLMENRAETDPDKKMRRMMRSSQSNFQFGAGNMQMNPYSNPMPMPMPCCGGGGYGGMNSNVFPYPSPMMMPMQNMGYYPPVFSGPGQRPIVNIIS